MNFILARVICVLMGYPFGLFETGTVIAKSKHTDLRKEGSGNIGSTNSMRVLGVKAGFLTLAGDMGKCMLAMLIAFLIFRNMFPAPENGYRLLMLYAGVGAMLGHDYPAHHRFKGGKGVACFAGTILAFSPPITGIALVFFVSVVAITRYVSFGSMTVEIFVAAAIALFGHAGLFVKLDGAYLLEAVMIFAFIAVLCLFQHRANIVRIAKGEEHRFSFKNAGKKDGSKEA